MNISLYNKNTICYELHSLQLIILVRTKGKCLVKILIKINVFRSELRANKSRLCDVKGQDVRMAAIFDMLKLLTFMLLNGVLRQKKN